MTCLWRIPIIVAAGKGRRMGFQIKKQYLMLDNMPVLARTLMVFDRHNPMDDIVLVVSEKEHAWCRKHIIQPYGFARSIHLVVGGGTRQESVVNGVNRACQLTGSPADTLVLIHDGVRPFVKPDLIDRLMDVALMRGGCIPVLAVTDTLKQVSRENRIQTTLDRELIYRAQTPQVFRLDLIQKAFDHAGAAGFEGTDDASVMEHAGFPVYVIQGSTANIKLTTPDDLVLAIQIMTGDSWPH